MILTERPFPYATLSQARQATDKKLLGMKKHSNVVSSEQVLLKLASLSAKSFQNDHFC